MPGGEGATPASPPSPPQQLAASPAEVVYIPKGPPLHGSAVRLGPVLSPSQNFQD